MFTALGFACGKYTAVICLILTLASQRSPLQLSGRLVYFTRKLASLIQSEAEIMKPNLAKRKLIYFLNPILFNFEL